MEAWLGALTQSGLAEALRYSRWGYAAVNTLHVIGIATLFGSICVLDLRLIGVIRAIDLRDLERTIRPIAALGLTVAILSGALLFTLRAPEYFALSVFRAKLALIAVGVLIALATMRFAAVETLSAAGQRALGSISLICWLSVLVLGRLIAFVE